MQCYKCQVMNIEYADRVQICISQTKCHGFLPQVAGYGLFLKQFLDLTNLS